MEPRLIYLIRHGMIAVNGNKRFIGQIDLPLNEEGINQAKRLRQELSCIRFSSVYCSDLQRSVQTAEIIAARHGLQPVICPELREISLGEWEGRSFEEINRKYPEEFKARGRDIVNYQPPGGESFAQCNQRILDKLEEILRSNSGNILITGHAGVNRLILCRVMGMPIQNLFRVCQDYGCLNLILYGNFGYRLKKLNQVYRMIPV